MECPQCRTPLQPGQRFCQACGQAVAEPGLRQVWQLAQSQPEQLLQPAPLSGKLARLNLNLLEYSAVLLVCCLLGGFWAFGLWKFGLQMMIRSGTPMFLAYLIGLLLVLSALKSRLDRPLQRVYSWLGRVPYPQRALLGVVLPVLWCWWDSADVGSGFTHAARTVTIATLMGHILLRSGEYK